MREHWELWCDVCYWLRDWLEGLFLKFLAWLTPEWELQIKVRFRHGMLPGEWHSRVFNEIEDARAFMDALGPQWMFELDAVDIVKQDPLIIDEDGNTVVSRSGNRT